MNYVKYVNEHIGNTAEAIGVFFQAEIENAAREAGIDWQKTLKNVSLARSSQYQGDAVIADSKDNDGRQGVVVEIKKFRDKKGKEFHYPAVFFMNYRASYNQGQARLVGEKGGYTSVFYGNQFCWEAYQDYKKGEEVKPTPTNVVKPLSIDELDEKGDSTSKTKEWNLDRESAQFERYLPLSHKKAFSPYLSEACVSDVAKEFDIRIGKDEVKGYFTVFPTQNLDGEFCGLQRIYHDVSLLVTDDNPDPDNKEYSYGMKKKGAFFLLGSLEELHSAKGYYRVEGLSTGLSIRAATGLPVFVLLDKGNLVYMSEPLVEFIAGYCKHSNPQLEGITICDNDNDDYEREHRTEENKDVKGIKFKRGNPGVEAGAAIIRKVGGFAFVPRSPRKRMVDANDVHKLHGLDELRQQLRTRSYYFNGRFSHSVTGSFNFIR